MKKMTLIGKLMFCEIKKKTKKAKFKIQNYKGKLK